MGITPDSIAELLEIVDRTPGGDAGPSAGALVHLLGDVPPTLVAHENGQAAWASGFDAGFDGEFTLRLARELPTRLARADTARWTVDTPRGPRSVVGLRLSDIPRGALVACLLEEEECDGGGWTAERLAVRVCSTLTQLALRFQSREAELRARIEQLSAGHEALRVSYHRSLADAIDEHEAHLREREESERALERLHARNKLILDSAGEGIVGLDADGVVVFVNPATQRMVQWRSEEMIGMSLHQLVQYARGNGAPYDWSDSPVCRTLCQGVVQRVDQEVFWRKDGVCFPVEYLATPMRDGDDILGAVLTFQDITERRLLQDQVMQAQKLESIGQLAAGIAHEINTPTQFISDNLCFLEDAFRDLLPVLTGVRSLTHPSVDGGDQPRHRVEKLETAVAKADLGYLVEEIPRAISQSREGIGRVSKIVGSMQELSCEGHELPRLVKLNHVLECLVTVSRNEWRYVADVVTDFDPDLPEIDCFASECNQAFLNLIVNAAQAIAEKLERGVEQRGTISIRTRRDGDGVEVRVADTGTGIAEAHRNRVYDPFFTTKPVGRGTGQGLSVARSVFVDRHGGTIRFESRVGVGTTFIIRLPSSFREAAAAGARP